MVVLSEIRSMFWGVTLDGGKRYTQTVERSFHISMAALEPPSTEGNLSPVSLMVNIDKAEFLLCTLGYGNILQQPLDLMFTEGEEVTFFLNGSGIVHLSGYLVEDQPEDASMYPDDISSEDEDSEDIPALLGDEDSDEDSDDDDEDDDTIRKALFKNSKKRKLKDKAEKSKKKVKVAAEEEEDSDDDDDDDFEIHDFDEDDSDDDTMELGQLANLDDESFDEDSEEEEEVQNISKSASSKKQTKSAKENKQQTNKQEQKKKNQQQTKEGKNKEIVSNNKDQKLPDNTAKSEDLTEGKNKKKKKKKANKDSEQKSEPEKPRQQATPKKRVLAGGTLAEELKIGHGPEASSGKMVSVYYVGTLSANGKQFDSCKQGKPFRFRLGKNEVIKGWDTGVAGMKVGGKRRLTIPPHQGYGGQRQGPIPANSTLVFDVELKAVN